VTADCDDDRHAHIDACRAHEANTIPVDRELVSEALNRLQPLHREVIRKAQHLGWTTGQIAADLHMDEPVVKSQLHNALHTLRHLLVDPPLRWQ
jgi:RNA polymerase sigma-70 factor (ECF subfamily)